MPNWYFLFFPSLFFSLSFSKWAIVKQFMNSLSACVFIGSCELDLKPSPELVFETWKETPKAPPPSFLSHLATLTHFFLSLSFSLSFSHSLTHVLSLSLSRSCSLSPQLSLWHCYRRIISYYFIGSLSCQKTPSWNIQQAQAISPHYARPACNLDPAAAYTPMTTC